MTRVTLGEAQQSALLQAAGEARLRAYFAGEDELPET